MFDVLPAIPAATWDVVEDADGFSAEASVEHPLVPHEVGAFATATRTLNPVVRIDGERRIRGIATVDEDALWIYVHAVGPGPYDDSAAVSAREVLVDLWRSVHAVAGGGQPGA